MLSIGKLAAGAEDYYLSAVAAGVEDYYLGPTEAPGRWAASAHLLGLAGEVGPDQLRAVLAGRHPGTGEALAAANRRGPGSISRSPRRSRHRCCGHSVVLTSPLTSSPPTSRP